MTEPDLPIAAVPTAAEISGALEALLLMADEPMTELVLAEAVGAPETVTREALEALATFYDETGRGFELRRVGGGWRYWTRVEHAGVIAAHVVAGQNAKLSQAALETLAVIAYQQPVSRGRVAAIRGVNVDGVIRTLLARDLVEEAGHDVDTGAAVFATTQLFLQKMGLVGLDDLPPLAPHLPDVEDLEAELSALAAPVVELVPEPVPTADPWTDHQNDPETDHQNDSVPAGQDASAAVPAGQDEEVRA
ncbi:SMC-Scp complex subunit ScpB [Microlunatus antarcticus]|uniref:Segregation and condensation protein B n=1 Tax=Microlunatus antarcticus TaxID=53388 RepID=A0A7W5JTX7_9ACTN|nr:SMC-Scp complex subunit ScpB [Microlunatus antarcticus]MBB3326289.1 segregation and condensation protein B [Microlunatus antarcticus]